METNDEKRFYDFKATLRHNGEDWVMDIFVMDRKLDIDRQQKIDFRKLIGEIPIEMG